MLVYLSFIVSNFVFCVILWTNILHFGETNNFTILGGKFLSGEMGEKVSIVHMYSESNREVPSPHTDAVVSFESFRALKLTLFESFRVLNLITLFEDIRALILSGFEIFRGLKLTLFENFRALNISNCESFRVEF